MVMLPDVTFAEDAVVFHYGPARVHGGKRVVFIEDDPTMLSALRKEGYEVVAPYELRAKVWELILDHPQIAISPLKPEEEGRRFHHSLSELIMGIHLTLSEWSDFGVRAFANGMRNLSPNVRSGHSLFGSMQGKIGLVCGAGPSLHKVERMSGCMLACGSAMRILNESGVTYTAGVGVDPHPLHPQFTAHGPYAPPLFYQSRLSPELLKLTAGEKLFIGGRDYMSRALGLPPVDPGWNAGTFGVVLAYHLGCDPIVTIGFDGNEKVDFQMGRRFLTEFVQDHPERTYINASAGDPIDGFVHGTIPSAPPEYLPEAEPLQGELAFDRIEVSLTKSVDFLEQLIEKGGSDPLFEVALEEEVGYKEVLTPVWDVWRPMIEGKDPLQKVIFLHTVATRYKESLCDHSRDIC